MNPATLKLPDIHTRDVLGNPIKPGDYIVYGAAKGRCAGLNIGLVIDTVIKDPEPYHRPTGPYLSVTAAACLVEWRGEYRRAGVNDHNPASKPKNVTLSFSERMCVVPASSVPDAIKALLTA